MLETATKYVLDLLTENEELKKFPAAFVNESVKWVKSWFLTPEDPKTNAKLEDPNKSMEVKKDIIQDKLADLNENPQFVKELTEKLKGFEQQRARLKNVVADADIDIKGSVHIGDKGTSSGDNYDEKNVIKGGSIKAGGDFRLGDDVVSGNQNVHIVHNYSFDESKLDGKYITKTEVGEFLDGFNGSLQKATNDLDELLKKMQQSETTEPTNLNAPPQYSSLKTLLQQLIKKEKIEEALDLFMDEAEKQGLDCFDELLLLSARFNRAQRSERKGTDNPQTERNRINDALITLIKDLE